MKFSIITPIYNRADCIARCIESVIKQKSSSYELEHIIVDDGSTDDSVKIIKKYAMDYPHIHLIAFPRNRGTNAARNKAIATATGDFCIILDSDDFFVDDALQFVHSVITEKNGYGHYMFAPDDMQCRYRLNPLLNVYQNEIIYQDFLSGAVSGDFVHVIRTSVLEKYPFEESVRIYEGVFFLRFYKATQKILFTNRIVSIRERNRKDSVTRNTIRTDKAIIARTADANRLYIQWFAEDLIKYGYNDRLNSYCLRLLDNLLLLGNYKEARNLNRFIQFRWPVKYRIIYALRLGSLYRNVLSAYLHVKYNILKHKIS